ncbi:hypothetical protein ACOSQ4_020838 [Xanthoceras sorbifolium]
MLIHRSLFLQLYLTNTCSCCSQFRKRYCGLTGGSPLFKCFLLWLFFITEACEKCGRASSKIFYIEKKELSCSSSLLGEVEYLFLSRWCFCRLFFFSDLLSVSDILKSGFLDTYCVSDFIF